MKYLYGMLLLMMYAGAVLADEIKLTDLPDEMTDKWPCLAAIGRKWAIKEYTDDALTISLDGNLYESELIFQWLTMRFTTRTIPQRFHTNGILKISIKRHPHRLVG